MQADISKLYGMIEKLKDKCCHNFDLADWKELTLGNCSGRHKSWIYYRRGIYFFFDTQEKRTDGSLRVVRVGTHAIKTGESKSTLWGRLKQHKGNNNSGGNHRGSIFRLLVGDALIRAGHQGPESWGVGNNADALTRQQEGDHEDRVSEYIARLPFLVLRVDSSDGDLNHRKYLESNIISLLSNFNRRSAKPPCPDEPSETWLGRFSSRDAVKNSGLWNNQRVFDSYESSSLDLLAKYVEEA